MTDLRDLLDRAAGTPTPVPAADDLARARIALRRRQRTRVGAGCLVTVLALSLGVGAAQLGGQPDDTAGVPTLGEPDAAPQPDALGLVPADIVWGDVTVTKVPAGWEEQQRSDTRLVIAPGDGSVTEDPADLTGKYVLDLGAPPTVGSTEGTWAFGVVLRASQDDSTARLLIRVPETLGSKAANALVGAIETAEGPLSMRMGGDTGADTPQDGPDPSLPLPPDEQVFHVPTIPAGWELQGSNLNYALLAPADGSAGEEFGDFTGKIVIGLEARGTYDELRTGDGREVERDGRAFYVWTGEKSVQIAVLTRAGEPEGTLRLQAPARALGEQELLALLGSVTLDAGARAGLG